MRAQTPPRPLKGRAARRELIHLRLMSDPSSRRSTAICLAAVGALAGVWVVGGLIGEDERTTAYCVTPDQEVVENRECDDDRSSGHFWYFANPGSRTYGRGDRVSAANGDLVRATDTAALSKHAGFGSTARGESGFGVGRSSSVHTSGFHFSAGG
jgi:hypothetical protein